MSGIIITEMENIDEELSEKELERLNFKKLRETKQRERAKEIEAAKKADEQKQNTQKQTGVSVKNTPNGTVTTKIKTEEDGSKTEETEEVDSNVDDTDSEKDIGFDSDYQKDETKRGVDTSDVKDGKEENIPDKPDKPLENAEDASKNRNAGDGLKQGEHCSTDEQSESPKPEQIGEDGLENENSDKINCTDPDSTGLNDLQKEVIWVALDMLKWQPTSDKKKNGVKREWQHRPKKYPEGIKETDPFYSNYQYPNDPTFGMHSDVTGSPLVRLKKFYNGMISSDSKSIIKAKVGFTTPWCAQAVSVIYAFAMASLKVKHKTKQNNGTRVCINKYKDTPGIIPFKIHPTSATLCGLNVKYFGYDLSWEPTVGAMKFVTYAKGDASGGCGHIAIVIHVTEEKDIVVVEGNGASDYSIRFWKRSEYYETSYKRMGHETKPKNVNYCHWSSESDAFWQGVSIPPRPTTSLWHSPFINPSISSNLEWTEKVSRPGNPIDEVKKLVNGFYNIRPRPGDTGDFDIQT